MKITASRFSEGNKLFPAEIEIKDTGISVKTTGLFTGNSTFLSYDNISSVSIETPMIGYSTIVFCSSGANVMVHGFKKDEVEEVQRTVEKGKKMLGKRD